MVVNSHPPSDKIEFIKNLQVCKTFYYSHNYGDATICPYLKNYNSSIREI